MKLDRQIGLYSIDTTFLYFEDEKKISDDLNELKIYKKEVVKKDFEKVRKSIIKHNDILKKDKNFIEFCNARDKLKSLYELRKKYKEDGWHKQKNINYDKYEALEIEISRLYKIKTDLKDYVSALGFLNYNNTFEAKELKWINNEIKILDTQLKRRFEENMTKKRSISKNFRLRDRISNFESSLIRTMQLKPNEFTNDLIVIRVYYYPILKSIMEQGFTYGGENFIFWSSSAGQIRTKKAVFIRESVYNEIKNTLTCGLDIDAINVVREKEKDGVIVEEVGCNCNKLLTYTSLLATGSDRWEDFDIYKTIVVDDFETVVNGVVDYINYNEYNKDNLWKIDRRTMDITIPTMDGCGVSLDYTGMFRLPWCKGLFGEINFVKFIKEKKKHFIGDKKSEEYKNIGIVTDIYGKRYDIVKDGIRNIMTKSQFKMWKYYRNVYDLEGNLIKTGWEVYQENFVKYNCEACKGNSDVEKYKKSKTSYQVLQTLFTMTDDEIYKIVEDTNENIRSIGRDLNSTMKLLGATNENDKRNYYQQALINYPELVQDGYSKKVLRDTKDSLVNGAKYGRLQMDATYVFAMPDLYAFCEWLLLHDKTPKGLLKDGEVSCRLIEDNTELDITRSPFLNFAHIIATNKINEDTKKWYTSNAVYTPINSLYSLEAMCDWDGDILMLNKNKTIIEIAKRIRDEFDIVPLYYELQKAKDTKVTKESLYKGLTDAYSHGNIGEVSNNITKVWNKENVTKRELMAISYLTLWNNVVIDSAKTLWFPDKSNEMELFLKGYTRDKLPYFFSFIPDKDKKESDVMKDNNSVVNRIKKFIVNPPIEFNIPNGGEFDYHMLLSDNTKDVRVAKCLEKRLVNRFNFYTQNQHIFKRSDEEQDRSFVTQTIRERMNWIWEDDRYIADVLINHYYNKKNSDNKRALWEVYGDIILENIKRNVPQNTKLCEVCGKRFEYNERVKRLPKYCEECAKVVKNKQNLSYYHENSQ